MRVCSLLLVAVLVGGCEGGLRGREAGALGGGALGAGLGAIIGNQTGHSGEGIAIGAALGALSGAMVGNSLDNTRDAAEAQQAEIDARDHEISENRRMINELKQRGLDVRTTSRGVVVNLPDVLFEFDSARLTPEARRTVDEIATAVRQSDRHLAVEGHTDSVGTIGYNQRLSEDRARGVADQLVMAGISRHQISSHGYGETRPIATNSTDSGRSRNRRVEVVIENR